MATELMRSERNLSTLAAQLGDLWSKQPPMRRAIAALVPVVALGVVAYVGLAPRPRPWVAIATVGDEAAGRDEAAILEEAGVGTRHRGRQLWVAAEQEPLARRLLATSPHSKLSRSAAEQERGSWRDLLHGAPTPRAESERQIAESLMAMAPIQTARVHLTLGRKSAFREQQLPPTAAVLVHLRDEAVLTAEQLASVRRLVASAVEGLAASDVTVVDQLGRSLDPSTATTGERAAREAEVAAKARAVLAPVVGAEHVIAVATATLAPAPRQDAPAPLAHLRLAVLVDPQRRATAPDAGELSAWTRLVEDAVGLDETRGDRLWLQLASFAPAPAAAAPAAPPPARPPLSPPAPRADGEVWRYATLAAGGIALLAMGLSVAAWRGLRRARARAQAAVAQAAAAQAQLAARASNDHAPTAAARLGVELARASHVLASDVDAAALIIGTWLDAAGEHAPRATPAERAGAGRP